MSSDSFRPHIILFGPPGAGKSTQAALLSKRWPIRGISTGKMLREEVAAGSELGISIRETLARGELIDDELMIKTVRHWISTTPPEQGFLLDGFPRTVVQAQALDQMLIELKRPLTCVIKLNLTVSEAIYRLGGRRICYGDWPEEIIHINDEQAVSSCLRRGGLLVQRPDDLPNVIVHRLAVYEADTAPLVDFYSDLSLVHSIEASGSEHEINQRIASAVEGARAS